MSIHRVDLEWLARDALAEMDIPGREHETRAARRDAIAFAWLMLRDRGEATSSELANAAFDVFSGHPKFGYTASSSHYRGFTFWDCCGRDALKKLPGVDALGRRRRTWRYTQNDG